jgi:hypothetical protein
MPTFNAASVTSPVGTVTLSGNVSLNPSTYTVANSGWVNTHLTADSIFSAGSWAAVNSDASVQVKGCMELTGDNADIKINGQSLTKVLADIQETLCMPKTLSQNAELEAEYQDLRELAEEYERRVRHYQEQRKIFSILKDQE